MLFVDLFNLILEIKGEKMEKVIEAKNLEKVYKLYKNPKDRLKETLFPKGKVRHKSFSALSDISFSVEKGESVGIIGKNGSGKSTLLKILTGVITESGGSLETREELRHLLSLGQALILNTQVLKIFI